MLASHPNWLFWDSYLATIGVASHANRLVAAIESLSMQEQGSIVGWRHVERSLDHGSQGYHVNVAGQVLVHGLVGLAEGRRQVVGLDEDEPVHRIDQTMASRDRQQRRVRGCDVVGLVDTAFRLSLQQEHGLVWCDKIILNTLEQTPEKRIG